jgi:CBS domain containing-hemolysin-like protein
MLEMKTSVVNLLRWYEREPMVAYPVYHQKKTQVVGWVDMRKVTRSGYQGKSLKPWLEEPVTVDWSMPFHDAMNLFFEKEVPLLFVMKDERVVGFVPWVDALQRMLR